MDMSINGRFAGLKSLMVFRDILDDDVIRKFTSLADICAEGGKDISSFSEAYSGFFFALLTSNHNNAAFKTCSLGDYVVNRILFGDTAFGKMAEHHGGGLPDNILMALRNDLEALEKAFKTTSGEMIAWYCREKNIELNQADFPSWDNSVSHNPVFSSGKPWPDCAAELAGYYRENGSGMFARCKGFIWERHDGRGSLRGIPSPDPIRLSDFIGYELQRKQVVENTLQFMNGYEANNMLLYGDRGTGKSSTVKALLNEYHQKGLRMIEMPKHLLSDFHEVIRTVHGKPLKFIVFIDDLSFDDDEDSYTSLKAVLEGGLENKPRNLLIYATTNRRHLIKERFSDRSGFYSENPGDEVHAADTMQEKLSLADRFGITVTFESPDQEKYLEIVDEMAKKRGIPVSKDILNREAIRWEMRYNGRSPRTALQFINWLEGQKGFLDI